MTPQRKAYLAKCSKRELILREKIKFLRELIRNNKANIQCLKADKPWLAEERVAIHRYAMHISKWKLTAYRHELARLNMDRVVVPKLSETPNGIFIYKKYECVCSEWIDETCRYCPTCGRRILWEKVK